MSEWFFAHNGAQQGPVSLDSLRQLAATGQLKPGDLVWTAGMAAWEPAGLRAEIFPPRSVPPPISAAPISYAIPAPYAGPQQSIGENAGVRWLLPVGRSGWAIAAGYLGLFSFIIFPAPLALICSIIAIIDIRKHPQRHGMGRAIFGLIMGVLGTIALAFMLVAMVSSHAARPSRIGGY